MNFVDYQRQNSIVEIMNNRYFRNTKISGQNLLKNYHFFFFFAIIGKT